MHRHRAMATLAVALLALALPAAASADWERVIQDCADDGALDRHYDDDELDEADKRMPSDINEYTDCRAVIRAARNNGGSGSSNGPGASGGAGGAGGSGGGGAGGDPGSTTPSGAKGGSAADVAALRTDTESARRSKPSIQADGRTVTPASSGLNDVAGAANALPASLIVAIALLAGLCAAGGAVAARRRWPDLVRAPLRLIRR
jgi:hypothetical protein